MDTYCEEAKEFIAYLSGVWTPCGEEVSHTFYFSAHTETFADKIKTKIELDLDDYCKKLSNQLYVFRYTKTDLKCTKSSPITSDYEFSIVFHTIYKTYEIQKQLWRIQNYHE